jgi:RHS repeat-associated protein
LWHGVILDYDDANNLTSITDADSKLTGYEYDPLNRLKKVNLPGGGQSVYYDWFADGLLKRVTYATGVTRDYSYDNADRVASVTNTLRPQLSEDFDYTYDRNSNRDSETRKQNGQTVRTIAYGYDELNRLSNATYTTPAADLTPPPPGGTRQVAEFAQLKTYGYDTVGNRKTETAQDRTTTITLTTDANGNTTQSRANQNGPLTSLTYDYNDLNRLTKLAGKPGGDLTYAYDNNGNLQTVSQSGTLQARYEYDVRDQLRRAVDGHSNEVARYDYDCERRRLKRTVAGTTLSYVYAAGHVVNEYSGTQLQNRYDVGANEIIRGELATEGKRYYFSDGQGSVTALGDLNTPSNPTFGARYEYDAWGESLNTAGSSANAIGYTGQRLDPETGLMALGNGERYYLPSLGRFIQQDSWTGVATMAQSMNRYAYTTNNPLRYTDPTGHEGESILWDVAKDVGTGIGHSFENFGNTLLEPVRWAADTLTVIKARSEGIDAEHIQLSSAMGRRQQQQILAGQSPSAVAVEGIREVVTTATELAVMAETGVVGVMVPVVAKSYESIRAMKAGEITSQQFAQQMGESFGDVLLLFAMEGAGKAFEHFKPRLAEESLGASGQSRMGFPESEGMAAEGALKTRALEETTGELRDGVNERVDRLAENTKAANRIPGERPSGNAELSEAQGPVCRCFVDTNSYQRWPQEYRRHPAWRRSLELQPADKPD